MVYGYVKNLLVFVLWSLDSDLVLDLVKGFDWAEADLIGRLGLKAT